MKRILLLLCLLTAALVTSCSSDPEVIVEEVTRIVTEISEAEVTRIVEVEVTREVEVTYEVPVTEEIEVTREVEVTKLVEVIVTPTHTPTSTPTPGPSPTPTPSLTPTPSPTPTSSPTATPTRDYRQDYGELTYGELINYPDNHIGEKIKISGRVFNIKNEYYQIWLSGGNDSVIVIHSICSEFACESVLGEDHPLPEGIYDRTWITVYGTVGGTLDGTNAFGGTISTPFLFADVIVIG